MKMATTNDAVDDTDTWCDEAASSPVATNVRVRITHRTARVYVRLPCLPQLHIYLPGVTHQPTPRKSSNSTINFERRLPSNEDGPNDELENGGARR